MDLRFRVIEIRKVLDDRPDQPAFIVTFPKRGYQFVAPVSARTAALTVSINDAVDRMVGRNTGLARLAEYLQLALRGQRQVAFVTGEAGIGKTTLVDAFQNQSASDPNLRVARGQCIEDFGGIEPYYPILEAIGSLIRREEDGSLIQALSQRAPTWLIQFSGLIRPEQRERLQQEIVGSTRERMMRELCETLEIISIQMPLLIVLEDLHWADPSTLDLISAFARRREPAKVLLLGTYRPVDVVLSQSPLKTLKRRFAGPRLVPRSCLGTP